NGIPVEKTLVMHLDSVDASAMPDLTAQFGLDHLGFLSGPPRAFMRTGLGLLRIAGVPGAIKRVVVALGYPIPTIEEDLRRYFDGSLTCDEPDERCGADGSVWTFRVRVAVDEALSTD